MSINMQEWREETTAIVNELLADGSNPDLDYEIEHHFACQDFELLAKAAVNPARNRSGRISAAPNHGWLIA